MQSRIQALPEHVRFTAERERDMRNSVKERVDSKLGHHAGETSTQGSRYVGVRRDPRTGKFYGSINSTLLIPG
jgi:hypothetical protein